MLKLSELKIGDVVVTKKNHPCGSNQWQIVNKGADFKLQCKGCSHTVVMASETLKKAVKAVITN